MPRVKQNLLVAVILRSHSLEGWPGGQGRGIINDDTIRVGHGGTFDLGGTRPKSLLENYLVWKAGQRSYKSDYYH